MATELPASVKPYAGRITDIDSHEQIPAQGWVEAMGEVMRPFAELKLSQPSTNINHPNVAGYTADVAELSRDNVWLNKGPGAPGAYDVRRRVEVMDLMHIRRQLMFPTGAGLYGMMTYTAPEGSGMYRIFGDKSRETGRKMMDAGNDWMIRAAKVSSRVRPVANLYGETVEELTANARHLIQNGIRALMGSASLLPAGLSPAHDALDPFYAMLAEAKVPLTFHVGGESMFLRSEGWGEAQAFQGYKVNEETTGDPLRLSTMHLAAQNFLSVLVLGGVFQRHPELRVAITEYGAHFIGPLASSLDMWTGVARKSASAEVLVAGQNRYHLPMKPSEYIRRNVRVSPFDFEPVGEYIEKHGLEEVYCFASDYPHVEGGRDPIQKLAENLSAHGHGASVFEKFFVTNGEWLLAD
jgi:predicted TIM-barrel fold metal-dependent hydrolase